MPEAHVTRVVKRMSETGVATALLRVENVAAGYRGRAVIEGVELCIEAGEFVGLLGANGAGKSTLLRALTGQIPLLAGRVMIGGIDLQASPELAKRGFGYAVDGADLPQSLTGGQYLEFVASIRGCAPDDWPLGDLLGPLSLEPHLRRLIGDCSLGTRMKFSLAGAMLGGPGLIILDESLNGLDPVSAWRVRRRLAGLVRTGRHAVLLASHAIETIAVSCSAAVFVEDGRIAHRWGPRELGAGPAAFEGIVMRALGEPAETART
jgi:ABC-2 type transport system ATP-binding protein